MTVVLVKEESLVTMFAGDLTPDIPTRLLPRVDDATEALPAVDDTPTERFFLSWFDAANALVDPIGESATEPLEVIELPDTEQEKTVAVTVAKSSTAPTFCLMLKIERGLRNL